MHRPQLFLLHFAGGSCYSYNFLEPFLKDFEFVVLELPGRGKRIKETLIYDFENAAYDIFFQIRQKVVSPYFLIYGHSLGASLALRVTNMLEQSSIVPSYLIVSGSAGPGVELGIKDLDSLDQNDFFLVLQKMGGMPESFLKSKALLDFFEPILRADFGLVNNTIEEHISTTVPLFAMMGADEEHVSQIENWSRFTTSNFCYELLPGNHFFILQHPQKVANILKRCYKSIFFNQ